MEPEWISHLDRRIKTPRPLIPGDRLGRIRDEFEAAVEEKYNPFISVAKPKKLVDRHRYCLELLFRRSFLAKSCGQP